MTFIIHSKSERGFWNNKIGWVLDAVDATVFPVTGHIMPKSKGDDAEYLPFSYEE